MAAVLCDFMSDVCKGTCNAVGKVICLPCRACGFATRELGDVFSSPFCLYLSVALSLNLPPIGFAIKAAIGGWQGSCKNSMQWLTVNAILCAFNMAAAIYIANQIQYERDETVTVNKLEDGTYYQASAISTGPGGDTSSQNSFTRIKTILCYDPIVACYILIGIFYLIWQSVGMSRWLGSDDGCDGGISGLMFNSLICDWLFIILGATAFGCSVCCLKVR